MKKILVLWKSAAHKDSKRYCLLIKTEKHKFEVEEEDEGYDTQGFSFEGANEVFKNEKVSTLSL